MGTVGIMVVEVSDQARDKFLGRFEIASFNASNLIYRKEQLLSAAPAHLGANEVFNSADVAGGAPALPVPGS